MTETKSSSVNQRIRKRRNVGRRIRAVPIPKEYHYPYTQRRCIELQLEEEDFTRKKPRRIRSLSGTLLSPFRVEDMDIIKISWYDGTTTSELQEYVSNAITRRIGKPIMDYRILDVQLAEEIVLTPYIPHASKFLVKYSLPPPIHTIYDYSFKAPYSPSRALSPVNSCSDLDGLCSALEDVLPEQQNDLKSTQTNPVVSPVVLKPTIFQSFKHNIFVIFNYFLLFLSIITLFAEIYERSPRWLESLKEHVDQVQSCAVDRDSLFECVSNGDIKGLLASLIIWMSTKGKTTRRVFLFGFDSVQKLWTVVYEAMVSSFCWGLSYMFIRRGLNPDTRQNFLLKYWKDCCYGVLGNFVQNFIKTVMKNLIPKETVEEAFQEAYKSRAKFGFLDVLLNPFQKKKIPTCGDITSDTALE